jgi:hypothetical protein
MSERRSSAIRRASPMTGTPAQQAPVEPVLDMDEIQGIAVPGFFKPHQTLVYVHLPRQRDAIDKFRGLLREFLPAVATAAKTLKDRREHRQIAASLRAVSPRRRAPARQATNREVLVAVAFSTPGLLKLTPGASEIPRALPFRVEWRHARPCSGIRAAAEQTGALPTGWSASPARNLIS